jgi:hypothetical protein
LTVQRLFYGVCQVVTKSPIGGGNPLCVSGVWSWERIPLDPARVADGGGWQAGSGRLAVFPSSPSPLDEVSSEEAAMGAPVSKYLPLISWGICQSAGNRPVLHINQISPRYMYSSRKTEGRQYRTYRCPDRNQSVIFHSRAQLPPAKLNRINGHPIQASGPFSAMGKVPCTCHGIVLK